MTEENKATRIKILEEKDKEFQTAMPPNLDPTKKYIFFEYANEKGILNPTKKL